MLKQDGSAEVLALPPGLRVTGAQPGEDGYYIVEGQIPLSTRRKVWEEKHTLAPHAGSSTTTQSPTNGDDDEEVTDAEEDSAVDNDEHDEFGGD